MNTILSNKRWIAGLGLLLVFAIAGSGCRILKTDMQSKMEKKQEKEDKKIVAEYHKARKAHFKNQSKSSKQMMKKTKKRASLLNKMKKK